MAGFALASIAVVAFTVVPDRHESGDAAVVTLPPAAAAAVAPTATTPPTPDTSDPAVAEPSERPSLSPLSARDDTEVAAEGPPPASGPVRVLVAGDSTAQHLAEALLPYAATHSDQLVAGSAAFPGCGLSADDDGRMHRFTDRDGSRQDLDISGCLGEWGSIPGRVAGAEQIDVVLVVIGPWDAVDIRLADGRVVSVADPVGFSLVADAYTRFVADTTAAGAHVMWVTPPDTHLGWGSIEDPVNDPARWTALRSIIDGLDVQQLDLPGWLADQGLEGPDGRPDGVHLTPEADQQFVADVVGPALAEFQQPSNA